MLFPKILIIKGSVLDNFRQFCCQQIYPWNFIFIICIQNTCLFSLLPYPHKKLWIYVDNVDKSVYKSILSDFWYFFMWIFCVHVFFVSFGFFLHFDFFVQFSKFLFSISKWLLSRRFTKYLKFSPAKKKRTVILIVDLPIWQKLSHHSPFAFPIIN